MKRYIANITIEAKSPLKVGSNSIDFLQDSPVQKDWNGLPMILGTSFAGVLRKEFEKDRANELFGDEFVNDKNKEAKGSRVIISNALLCDESGKVCEGLLNERSEFLEHFSSLPKRDHTAIDSKGVALERSKFDEEIVYSGARFKFNIELISENKDDFKAILDVLFQKHFRIGGGSSKGFGEIKVEHVSYDEFEENSTEYENFTNSLNVELPKSYDFDLNQNKKHHTYKLSLKADDFFMFGGWYDLDADNASIMEKIIVHGSGKSEFSKQKVLIPASSIKGAIAHRTTYHYNRLNEKYIGNENICEAVEAIFGAKKDENKGYKGKILISYLYMQEFSHKVFDHVSIDRFTGGAIDGALFQEKTINSNEIISLEILLEKNIEDKKAIKAFEAALCDLANGNLPLGGATTKGHGFFSGKVFKDNEELNCGDKS